MQEENTSLAPFSDLVAREIKNQATPEEVAYLWSSETTIEQWKTELILMQKRVESQLTTMRAGMLQRQQRFLEHGKQNPEQAKHAWFTYKAEMETKIARASSFYNHVANRLVKIKLHKKEQHIASPAHASHPQTLEDTRYYRAGYTAGWRKAIGIMHSLIEDGLDEDDAYERCYDYWFHDLQHWRNSEEIRIPKPAPPHVEEQEDNIYDI